MSWTIRPATREDEPGIQSAIKEVYDEYGFLWDAEGYHSDLYNLDESYFALGDQFWVAELDGTVVGTVALTALAVVPGEYGSVVVEEDGGRRLAGADCELGRLYVRPSARKLGIGEALVRTVIEAARARNLQVIELWSDKQFGDAHRLYGRLGGVVVGERDCTDPEPFSEWGLLIDLRQGP